MEWSEFSFILQPSPLGGVGVFAAHDIPDGTHLFKSRFITRTMKVKDVPPLLLKYCIYISDEECICPERFDRMEIGWYLNHSSKPNVAKKTAASSSDSKSRNIYAIQDIKAGDEILIDYNCLNEPEHLKEDYYKVTSDENRKDWHCIQDEKKTTELSSYAKVFE